MGKVFRGDFETSMWPADFGNVGIRSYSFRIHRGSSSNESSNSLIKNDLDTNKEWEALHTEQKLIRASLNANKKKIRAAIEARKAQRGQESERDLSFHELRQRKLRPINSPERHGAATSAPDTNDPAAGTAAQWQSLTALLAGPQRGREHQGKAQIEESERHTTFSGHTPDQILSPLAQLQEQRRKQKLPGQDANRDIEQLISPEHIFRAIAAEPSERVALIKHARITIKKALRAVLEETIRFGSHPLQNSSEKQQKEHSTSPQHNSPATTLFPAALKLTPAILEILSDLAVLNEKFPDDFPNISKEKVHAHLNNPVADAVLASLEGDFASHKAAYISSRIMSRKSRHPKVHPPVPSPLSEPLRHLMRNLPASIVVLTTTDAYGTIANAPDPAGTPLLDMSNAYRGMTLSSFTTLTMSPIPTVTFNIRSTDDQPSRTFEALIKCNHFLIHLLDSTLEGARIADLFTRGNGERVFQVGEKEGLFKVKEQNIRSDPSRVKSVEWVQRPGEDEGIVNKLPALHGKGITKVLRCTIMHNIQHTLSSVQDYGEKGRGIIRVGDHFQIMAKVKEILDVHESEELITGVHGLSYADGKYRRVGEVIES
jgi:flavin reductase (DIM6/NTAB) family NADH-FMN oxidoreductase RutF